MPRRALSPGEEFRTAKAMLRSLGWTGPRGLEERKIALWLHHLYRSLDGSPNLGVTFELKDLARECDLIYQGTNQVGDEREYMHPVVRHYVHRMREAMEAIVDWFWTSPQYQVYVTDGLSDEQIMWKIIEVMVGFDIFPVWCDREGDERWKLMDLDAYARLREIRANAIRSEVGEKATKMELMMRRFHHALPGKYHPPALPFTDGFMNPPALGPGQGVLCPVEGCGLHWRDSEAWRQHFLRAHRGFIPPGDPPTGLDSLFGPS